MWVCSARVFESAPVLSQNSSQLTGFELYKSAYDNEVTLGCSRPGRPTGFLRRGLVF
jgi:hypothetical protein